MSFEIESTIPVHLLATIEGFRLLLASHTEFVHEHDEVCLGERLGRGGLPGDHVDGGGLELEDGLVVVDLLGVPPLVRVHVQVVGLHDGQALGHELKDKVYRINKIGTPLRCYLLPVDVDSNGGLLAHSILGDARQKMSGYQLEHPALVP